jgi:Flavodoxin domain
VAEAIFEEVPGDKEILPIGELENLDGYDLIFYGFPIQAGHPAKDAADFLTLNGAGKKIALFATHGAPEDAERVGPWLEGSKTLATSAGAELVGLFHCQGEASQEIVDFLLNSDNPVFQQYGREGAQAKGLPDKARLDKARDYTREILAVVRVKGDFQGGTHERGHHF